MSIIASELKLYSSAVANDTTANGGVMSIAEIVGGVKNNVWPDVPQAERVILSSLDGQELGGRLHSFWQVAP